MAWCFEPEGAGRAIAQRHGNCSGLWVLGIYSSSIVPSPLHSPHLFSTQPPSIQHELPCSLCPRRPPRPHGYDDHLYSLRRPALTTNNTHPSALIFNTTIRPTHIHLYPHTCSTWTRTGNLFSPPPMPLLLVIRDSFPLLQLKLPPPFTLLTFISNSTSGPGSLSLPSHLLDLLLAITSSAIS